MENGVVLGSSVSLKVSTNGTIRSIAYDLQSHYEPSLLARSLSCTVSELLTIGIYVGSKAPFTRHNLLSNRFDIQLYRVYKHSTGCQTRFTTGLTNGCIVYTAGCQTGLYNRFDDRLYRVNGVLHFA